MKKVFVSYSRTDFVDESGQVYDKSHVATIVDTIKTTNNIEVWIDINAKYSGKYFTSVLAKKILWADKVLFLSSKNSNASDWVSKEILFAHDNNKEIIPVRLDDSNYNVEFALILTGIDYIEYYKSPKHKITDIIENILGDSQEISDVNETPTNALKDSSVSNSKERKGCLSLNVNFKGCALSMSIAMCLFMAFGIFYKVEEKEELIALNETKQSANYDISTDVLEQKRKDLEAPKAEPVGQMRKKGTISKSPRQNGNVKQDANSKQPNTPKGNNNNLAQDKVGTKNTPTNDSTNTSRTEHAETETYIVQNENKSDEAELRPNVPFGEVGGPTYSTSKVLAGTTDSYQKIFKGGELAIVMVSSDGETDFDVFIYDSNGNLVASDTDCTCDCVIKWTPRWTERYRVVIKDKGNEYNNYTIRTNQ